MSLHYVLPMYSMWMGNPSTFPASRATAGPGAAERPTKRNCGSETAASAGITPRGPLSASWRSSTIFRKKHPQDIAREVKSEPGGLYRHRSCGAVRKVWLHLSGKPHRLPGQRPAGAVQGYPAGGGGSVRVLVQGLNVKTHRAKSVDHQATVQAVLRPRQVLRRHDPAPPRR